MSETRTESSSERTSASDSSSSSKVDSSSRAERGDLSAGDGAARGSAQGSERGDSAASRPAGNTDTSTRAERGDLGADGRQRDQAGEPLAVPRDGQAPKAEAPKQEQAPKAEAPKTPAGKDAPPAKPEAPKPEPKPDWSKSTTRPDGHGGWNKETTTKYPDGRVVQDLEHKDFNGNVDFKQHIVTSKDGNGNRVTDTTTDHIDPDSGTARSHREEHKVERTNKAEGEHGKGSTTETWRETYTQDGLPHRVTGSRETDRSGATRTTESDTDAGGNTTTTIETWDGKSNHAERQVTVTDSNGKVVSP